MQQAERIHPGGVPAQSQPYDEIPQSGKVNFRRLVLTTQEQNKPDNGTTENTKSHEQETATEVVPGRLYKWASNIAHLEDTEVQVEDLSDKDIDPQLGQETQDMLSKALKGDGAGKKGYFKSQQPDGLVTEVFELPGPSGDWRVCRKTYRDIDVHNKDNNQYPRSTIAKRISQEALAKAGPAPTDSKVKHVACRILTKNEGKLPDGREREKWPKLLREAHEELYIHRNDATFQSELDKEIEEAKQRPADCTVPQKLVDSVEKNLPTKKRNAFHQFMVDTEASNACEDIRDFDVVILRDRNHELICGVVTNAIQKLLPAGTVEKMFNASKAFAFRYPFILPDDLRHPTNQSIHLAQHPDKDVHSKECKQPHFAACGVEHYGLHHETGHSSGFKGLCFQEFSSATQVCPALLKSSAWKNEFPKLKEGVYGLATKVSRLSLKAWDPELYDQYLEVREYLPDSLKATLATTGHNPYAFLAHLVDPLTEGHTDSTDWEQGMAALTCFGPFTGKFAFFYCVCCGDLVLKELGVRVAFPSGSNCHLRGQGLHHLITGYQGIRHSIVLTNKASVRKTLPDFRNGLSEKMKEAAELQLKDPKDWSEDETKLHQAAKEGNNAVLELVWSLGKKKRKADDLQGEGPDEPLSKTKKKPKSQ